MTSAKKKKTPARKRGTASRALTFGLSRAKRFALSAGASALASFQIASCSFNPTWSVERLLNQTLAALHMPALDAFRKNGWPGMADAGAHTTAVGGRVGKADVTASAQPTRFANCPQFFPSGQAPALQLHPHERELCFSSFAVLHNGETKTPVFVAERLNRHSLQQGQGLKRTDKFYADARLPRAERSELDDYKHSGYSRGHMAPAGDMGTPEAMAQSFSLANMVPQNQVHNAGAWSQVEQATRKYAMRAQGDVFVFTGPVFAKNAPTIGGGKVAVPDYIFKLVYDASTGKSWVHWQANSADTRMDTPISYEEFTRRTGMPLLSRVRS
ncbi:MAG: DNA/RNA non-specific endonuclease [Comamonas sp.]|jgi:endonuclease G|nr:DNA/RNA non-specific endonuclease [Comamonas sp.]